jgi:hypothetical protein
MTEIKKLVVERYEFNVFNGSFEVKKTGWVEIVDPQGKTAHLHKDQIIAMADILKSGGH